MVIDTSALLAIVFHEPEAASLTRAILSSRDRWIAPPALVEASAVLYARKGAAGDLALDALVQRLGLVTIDMTALAAAYARSAFQRYGKGVGTPGVLNFGDCLVYGVARAASAPLLFTGNDFARTDVVAAVY